MDPTGVCNLFEDSVQISHDDITFALNPGEVDEPQEANQVLLGKIISRHRFGKAAIQGSLKLSWNAIKGWKWKELEDGIIQFTFARREDALNVLARRPWFVCRALIVIMPWPAWLSPTEVRFDKTPIWVHIDRIPPFYWNLSNLKELASKASPVYELPTGIEDAVGMSSLRFRATIDLNKPIFSGFYLRRQILNDLWIQYKYEKLPKLCFKCGLLTHEQSTCFKSPTIIKDANDNFFPMYGVWLKNEAPEKSTFSSPLAKWFHDWVLQKKLCTDSTTRNLLKVHRAIANGDAAELRECRRQFPGKKRIVTEEETTDDDTQPGLVITQLPMVYLPGIGEIAPFGNNSKVVSIQDLQEAAATYAAQKADLHASTQQIEAGIDELEAAGGMGTGANLSNSGEAHAVVEESLQTPKLNEKSNGTTNAGQRNNVNEQDQTGECSSQYNNSILGSQAQYLKWPSNECWAQPKARELIMGALTIDKYFREPSLINPILDIEDFRVHEHLTGPRKRKASDGFVVDSTVDENNTKKTSLTGEIPIEKPDQITQETINFSPGSVTTPASSSKRGKGRRNTSSLNGELSTPKRRGRPPKNQSSLATTPKSFKGSKSKKSRQGVQCSTSTQWEGRDFDLKVNLDNHFVIIEKHHKPIHYVPSVGLSGGLGMCWMKGVKSNIQHSSKHLISAEISSDPPGISWLLLGIYGPHNKSDKERFWIHVSDLVLNATSPILLLGDMNGTLHDSECCNYNGNVARYSFDFRRMVHRAGLIDLGFQGPVFTWVKGGNSSNGIQKMKRARLDRGMASTDWRILFPNAVVNHLSVSESDHRPLLLDTMAGVNCKRRQFKYENMWARDPRSFWVVKEAWKGRLHSNPMINFHRKVKET
ncbi:hypothetical protein F8388_010615 [Cannabis sativa]|uniref:DUF4283 domain-containing protein n=1 Tax=Cannabis sativa TaxID=3483 RepID=A0A7J6GQ55_CANSA|nr:hypothetical protein F8388_010615 [Cannabis sativa]